MMGGNNGKKTVQDDEREIQLCELLQLKHMEGRAGHDAEDEFGNKYELKSTTMTGFGTARDVSLEMINNWRQRYWICAKGTNLVSGFEIEELYFLSPRMLEGWFSQMEARFAPDEGLRKKILSAQAGKLSRLEEERLDYLIKRGMTYNNPHIGMNYVRKNGILINSDNPASHLRKLVRENPIY